MKIKKLEIHDFRGLSDVIIDNLDPHLNLLMGVNGAGKSSVLDAIALLLQSFTARLTTSAGRGIQISPRDVQKHSRRGCKLHIELDNNVSWTKYKSRGLTSRESDDLSMLYAYTEPIRLALDNEEPECLPIIAHYGVNRAVKEMASTIELRRYMMGIENNGISSETYTNWWNRGAIYRDFLLWFKETEAMEHRIRVNGEPKFRDRSLDAVRKVMKVIFPEYADIRMISPFQVGLIKDDELFSMEMLSDGEKCYITLVCDIVRRLAIANPTGRILEGEGIVLIDEVDLHLHPSWEATVMPKLHEVFPNIQFIVSAHSPLVASHFDGQVYGIDKGEVIPLPRIHGLDYSTILMDYMGVRPDNREVSSLVDMYRSYKRHNMIEQADAVYGRLVELMHGDMEASVFKMLDK